jgi:murein endopeptidase
MAIPAISDSVGRLGANKKEDVITIQKLLNTATKSSLSVTGICDEATIKCIEAFQKTFLPSADGRIDVGGQTIARLAMLAIGFVQLSQAPDPSYYSISPKERQFGTPAAIATVTGIANAHAALNPALAVGIGDISFKDGASMPPHSSHTRGIDADFRPLRKDGKRLPVTIHDTEYSRERTAALIAMFLANPNVKRILFNDAAIPGVTPFEGHDNHFHVNMKQ